MIRSVNQMIKGASVEFSKIIRSNPERINIANYLYTKLSKIKFCIRTKSFANNEITL